MDHLTVLIAGSASPNELRKLAGALEAVHSLIEVDAHLDVPEEADLDSLWLWTPWRSSKEPRCERAIKACIGWVGGRAARVRRAHQIVVIGPADQALFAAEITWPGRKIIDANVEIVHRRPTSSA